MQINFNQSNQLNGRTNINKPAVHLEKHADAQIPGDKPLQHKNEIYITEKSFNSKQETALIGDNTTLIKKIEDKENSSSGLSPLIQIASERGPRVNKINRWY